MILGVLLLTAGIAHAEEGLTGWGVGSKSCGQFIATIGKLAPGKYRTIDTKNETFVSENTDYQQWLMGFLTGFNFAHAVDDKEQPIPKRIDLAGMDLWMRNWCNQHPTGSFVDGASAFLGEMRTNAAAAAR
jgi:hypothetical protein